MIEVKNISKDFVSKKKYPGLKRVVKGLFTNEKYLEKMQENFCLTFFIIKLDMNFDYLFRSSYMPV